MRASLQIPSEGGQGVSKEPVRVCDVCYDQVSRGDPVCLSRQVARMRGESAREESEAARELANWAAMDPQFAHAQLVSACEQLRLPELVSQMLSSSRSESQAAAAALLSAMLQYPEYAELLESANVLGPLQPSYARPIGPSRSLPRSVRGFCNAIAA